MSKLEKYYKEYLQTKYIEPEELPLDVEIFKTIFLERYNKILKNVSQESSVPEDLIKEKAKKFLLSDDDILKDFLFDVFSKIDEEGVQNTSFSVESGDFDYYIDEYGLLNFPGRFREVLDSSGSVIKNNGNRYFDLVMDANAKMESGGRYTAQNDYGAYGKYQMMWANLVKWGKQSGIDVLGELNSADRVLLEYYLRVKDSGISYNKLRRYNDGTGVYNLNLRALNLVKKTSVISKRNQEKISKTKHKQYWDRKGDYALVIASWYCGSGRMTHPRKISTCRSGDPRYPNATEHVNKVLKKVVELGGGRKIGTRPSSTAIRTFSSTKLNSMLRKYSSLYMKKQIKYFNDNKNYKKANLIKIKLNKFTS